MSNSYFDYDDCEFDVESRRARVLDQIEASKNRQLDSCNRALQSIHESEQIGISTAEELHHQGEQLDNVERKVQDIDKNLTVSQRHINNIKSIFGGIKNWFSKGQQESSSDTGDPNQSSRTNLPNYNEAAAAGSSKATRNTHQFNTGGFAQAEAHMSDDARELEMDNYLGDISAGLNRLKGLSVDLQGEIVHQNEQLDRINAAVDKTQPKLEHQNRQIRKLLG